MLTPEIKEALKKAHPDTELKAVKVGDHLFVVRKPTHIEWERYEQEREDKDSAEPIKILVSTCVVYPDEPVFNKILADKFAIYQPLGDVIGKLVGLEKAQELESF